MTRRRTFFAAAALVAVALCASLVPSLMSSAAPDPAKVCAASTGHGAKTVCTTLHPGARGLLLPRTDKAHPWGGVARDGARFVTADGRSLPMTSKVTAQLARSHAYASTVYQATVSRGRVTKVVPKLRVAEDAVLQHEFAGRTYVGKISTFVKGSYGLPDAPVVVKVDDQAQKGQIGVTILNATEAVKVKGRTYPALSKNPKNPLRQEFTARSSISRVPSMHAAFDDEVVWSWSDSSSGMGEGFFPSVPTLFGKDALAKTLEIEQHGTPTSGPSLDLHRA